MTRITVNRNKHDVTASADTPLLWVLRDELDLTGTKYGCGKALCGACTVYLDGQPTRSCVTPLATVGDRQVTTIEGLDTAVASAVQTAWLELEVAQCGFCQGGQIMAAVALLERSPQPNKTDIIAALDGHLCRCATYLRIVQAVQRAAELLA